MNTDQRPPVRVRRLCASSATALLIAVAAAGCGQSGPHRPVATTAATATTRATLIADRVARPAHARGHASAHAPGHAARRAAVAGHPTIPVIRAGRVIATLRGSGDRLLGSLSETQTVVLQWHVTGPSVQLLTGSFLLVDSEAHSGRVRLARGTYPHLRIATARGWTLQVRAAR